MIAQEPYLKNENLGVSAYLSSVLRQFPKNQRKLSAVLMQFCDLIFFFPLQTDLNEVEQLLEKHANFEKLVNTQEERFLALERLTTVIYKP